MKITFKKIIGICLSMVLAFSVTLTAYAEPICGFGCLDDYEFDKATGHLFIGKEIESQSIEMYLDSVCFSPFSLESIRSVTIKDGVTKIVNNAFRHCSNLINVEIPDSVTSIGSDAFYGCTSLTSINIPDSVTSIESCTFQRCINLSQVKIPYGVTQIDSSAFEDCASLGEIIIPNSVTRIGKYAFHSAALKEVKIPGSVNYFCHAFDKCENLQKVEFSQGLRCISDSAFERCIHLKEIVIPNNSSMTEIGEKAFCGCNSLTSITIPEGVISIGGGAFKNCINLEEAKLPDSIRKLPGGTFFDYVFCREIHEDGLFCGCRKLKRVNIPACVPAIPPDLFKGCISLKEVTIPGSVTEIGRRAFEGCTSLKKVTIPHSVTSIEENAFKGCWGLKEVDIQNRLTSIDKTAFEGCTNLFSFQK